MCSTWRSTDQPESRPSIPNARLFPTRMQETSFLDEIGSDNFKYFSTHAEHDQI